MHRNSQVKTHSVGILVFIKPNNRPDGRVTLVIAFTPGVGESPESNF